MRAYDINNTEIDLNKLVIWSRRPRSKLHEPEVMRGKVVKITHKLNKRWNRKTQERESYELTSVCIEYTNKSYSGREFKSLVTCKPHRIAIIYDENSPTFNDYPYYKEFNNITIEKIKNLDKKE